MIMTIWLVKVVKDHGLDRKETENHIFGPCHVDIIYDIFEWECRNKIFLLVKFDE